MALSLDTQNDIVRRTYFPILDSLTCKKSERAERLRELAEMVREGVVRRAVEIAEEGRGMPEDEESTLEMMVRAAMTFGRIARMLEAGHEPTWTDLDEIQEAVNRDMKGPVR